MTKKKKKHTPATSFSLGLSPDVHVYSKLSDCIFETLLCLCTRREKEIEQMNGLNQAIMESKAKLENLKEETRIVRENEDIIDKPVHTHVILCTRLNMYMTYLTHSSAVLTPFVR